MENKIDILLEKVNDIQQNITDRQQQNSFFTQMVSTTQQENVALMEENANLRYKLEKFNEVQWEEATEVPEQGEDEVAEGEEELTFPDLRNPTAPSNPYILYGVRDGVTYIRSLRYPDDEEIAFGDTVRYRDHTLDDPGNFFLPKDQIYVSDIINDGELCQVGTIRHIRSADPTEGFDFASLERQKGNETYGAYFPADGNRRSLPPYIGNYEVQDDVGRTALARFSENEVRDYALLTPRITNILARLRDTLSIIISSNFNYWYMYCKEIIGPAVLYYHTLEKCYPNIAEKSLPEIAQVLQREGPWIVTLVPEVPGRARRLNAQFRVAELH